MSNKIEKNNCKIIGIVIFWEAICKIYRQIKGVCTYCKRQNLLRTIQTDRKSL